MKISHNELFAHKHLFIMVIIVLVCTFTVGMFFYAYRLTRNEITTNYRQTFEKKTWAGLEIYHQASKFLLEKIIADKDYNLQSFIDALAGISTFEPFDFIVTDSQGTILIIGRGGNHVGENVSQRDKAIEYLIRGEKEVTVEDINWQNKRVFAKGSAIIANNGTGLLYVSSYEKAHFDQGLILLHQKVVDIYVALLMRVFLFGLPGLVAIIIILKRHDAFAHHA